MAHNPPRLPGLSPQAAARLHEELSRRPQPRQWYDIAELADLLVKKSKSRRTVEITAQTAAFIGGHLRTVASKPTRDAIALMICKNGERNRCSKPCYECRGKANIVVRAYGQSIEPIKREE